MTASANDFTSANHFLLGTPIENATEVTNATSKVKVTDAPADPSGTYIYQSWAKDTIVSCGTVTIAAGETEGQYSVLGLHPAQEVAVTGTYANGKLTIAPGQNANQHATYGEIDLYPMVNSSQYSSNLDIVLTFAGDGTFELDNDAVGFLMLIKEGTYAGYSIGSTLTGGYFGSTANGTIASTLVNSDFSAATTPSSEYATCTEFSVEEGVEYASVLGVDNMTAFMIVVNADNTVEVQQIPSYYYSSSYKVAYPSNGGTTTSGTFGFQTAVGPQGTIDKEAGTITLPMWAFTMYNTAGTSFSVLNGRKYPSVITFPPVVPTGINDLTVKASKASKYIVDGQLVIEKDGVKYNAAGQTIK